jgi:hypothetical protein
MLNTIHVSKISATLALSLAVLSSITLPFRANAQTPSARSTQPFEHPARYNWSISPEPIPALARDHSFTPSDADALLALIDQTQIKPSNQFVAVSSLNRLLATLQLTAKKSRTSNAAKP